MSSPDTNFLSITTPGQVIEGQTIRAPAGTRWADLVHVNVPDVVIRGCTLDARGCRENAVDGHRAHRLLVEDCVVYAGAQCAFYVKSLTGATFRHNRLVEAGGHSDLYAGDYSSVSSLWTTQVVADGNWRADGLPWRHAHAHGDWPIELNMTVQRQRWLSLWRFLYVEIKYRFHPVPNLH